MKKPESLDFETENVGSKIFAKFITLLNYILILAAVIAVIVGVALAIKRAADEGKRKLNEPYEQIIYNNIQGSDNSSQLIYTIDGDVCSVTGANNPTETRDIEIPAIYSGKPVTSIGGEAFNNCIGLTSITIPDSVTSIGNYAFSGCSGLTTINYTGDLADWCAISGLYSLMGVGESTKSLYIDGALIEGDLIIPDGITSIGSWAFYDCIGLTSIIIPNGVTNIGEYAFYYCTGLTSVTNGNSVTSIGKYAFAHCAGLTSVTIGNSVTSIGNSAFSGCTGLTSITIPDGVTSIGWDAFYGCTGLTSVTFEENSQLTSIGGSAFYNCSGLTSITIPDSVTYMGEGAFSGCSSLESITIPFVGAAAGKTRSDTYQYPFGYAFGTNSYTGGTAVSQNYYGSSTSSMTNTTFYIPSTLRAVTVTGGDILPGAFSGCSMLVSITIPDEVTSIRRHVFYGCSGLTTITIPNGVTAIANYAFYGCSSLMSINIPNSVTSIGEYAFSSCANLRSITFKGTKAQWNAISTRIGWNSNTGSYKIYCTDGTINK